MLAASLVVAVALGAIGLGVSHSLSPSIVVPRSGELAGAAASKRTVRPPTQLAPILLRDPRS